MVAFEYSTSEMSSSDSRNSDDEAWEDLPDTNHARPVFNDLPAKLSNPSRTSSRGSTRRRRPGVKTIVVAQPTFYKQPSVKPPKESRPVAASTSERKQIQDVLSSGAWYTFWYISDILGTTFSLLRKPLAILLFLWLLGVLFGRLHHTFRTVLGPLCVLPGISRVCYIPPQPDLKPKWADYPTLMSVQSTAFEQLLDDSVGGSGISLEVKKAEMATSDLITLVRVSNLRSRDVLADTLVDFVDFARKTGRGLQKLSARINGAVDGIVAANHYALRSIEAENDKAKSIINYVWPLSASHTNEVVAQTFSEAMEVGTVQMQRVILEAQVSLANLDKLEQHLLTLYELITREDSSLTASKDEILSALWTKLGGNRRRVRGIEQHLALLRDIGGYRTRALAHVVAALHTLQAMSEDMEEMRERVAAPEIVGQKVPLHVQMLSIQSGLERLKEGRIKARQREEDLVRQILGPADD